ncbi:MAG: GAF domain-containing protein [Anaerolineae bacterium]|nr:GAF domain-containing protein [Anaerolineae bacterium]
MEQAQDTHGLLKRRTQELRTLVQVAQLVNTIDLDYVLAAMLQITTESVGARKGSFFLLDPQGMPIQRFLTQRNLPPEVSREVARDVAEKGLAGWCIRHQMSAIVTDILQDERWYFFPDDAQSDVRSALCVPVFYEGTAQGILTLVSDVVGYFDASHQQLVEAVAQQASTAVRNARLFDELQAQQRQLELVLQNTGEALFALDQELQITLANPEAVALSGQPDLSALVGQSIHAFPHSFVLGSISTVFMEEGARQQSRSYELRDEDTQRDYFVTVSPIHAGLPLEVEGYVVVVHDITSFRDLTRLKTHILHMLTHDIKNPMNVIWGYVDLLRIDSEKDAPVDPRFIDGIFRALNRMDSLIEEILNAERFMSVGLHTRYTRLNLRAVVLEAVEPFEGVVQQKQLALELGIDPNLGEAMGDMLQLREAMANLISNAVKYTPPGGQIAVRAETHQQRFYFSVEDTGMGIPNHLQHQLFKKFYRALRPETAGIEGTGLGLSLVKMAIEQHQGQVWFKSELNVGSTFGFWIPLIPEPNLQEPKEA